MRINNNNCKFVSSINSYFLIKPSLPSVAKFKMTTMHFRPSSTIAGRVRPIQADCFYVMASLIDQIKLGASSSC